MWTAKCLRDWLMRSALDGLIAVWFAQKHGLTNKDSIERSAPQMNGYNQAVIARSLDAIWGWTSPGASLAFCFLSRVAAIGYEE
jgi:hypothetical protein